MNKYIKSTLAHRRLWLCLPLLVTSASDAIATIFGQPANYWAGAYYDANEFNSVAHWSLSMHPLLFIILNIALFGIISLLVVLIPEKLAKILVTFLVLAHASGTNDWLKYVFNIDYNVRYLLIFIVAMVFIYSFAQAEMPISQSG